MRVLKKVGDDEKLIDDIRDEIKNIIEGINGHGVALTRAPYTDNGCIISDGPGAKSRAFSIDNREYVVKVSTVRILVTKLSLRLSNMDIPTITFFQPIRVGAHTTLMQKKELQVKVEFALIYNTAFNCDDYNREQLLINGIASIFVDDHDVTNCEHGELVYSYNHSKTKFFNSMTNMSVKMSFGKNDIPPHIYSLYVNTKSKLHSVDEVKTIEFNRIDPELIVNTFTRNDQNKPIYKCNNCAYDLYLDVYVRINDKVTLLCPTCVHVSPGYCIKYFRTVVNTVDDLPDNSGGDLCRELMKGSAKFATEGCDYYQIGDKYLAVEMHTALYYNAEFYVQHIANNRQKIKLVY